MLSARAHTWIRLAAIVVIVALAALPHPGRHDPVAQAAAASRVDAR